MAFMVQSSLIALGSCAKSARFGPEVICGLDEVGRGCLAGPVVASAVILPPLCEILGLTDSKKLTAKKREALSKVIKAKALAWALGLIGQKCIDRSNILAATLMAMAMAVGKLGITPTLLLIDGNCLIPDAVLARFWRKRHEGHTPEQRAIVRGDVSEPAISAASILAKTYRDALMQDLAKRFPLYGFESNKGYGSAKHRAMLAQWGPCLLHRRTFAGVVVPKVAQRSLLEW